MPSVAWGWAGGTPPPTKPKKCRNLVIFQMHILSKQRQESAKNFVKIYEKSILHKILIKKCQNFSKIWSFLVQIAFRFIRFPCLMEIIRQIFVILYFSTNYSQFSPKISRICTTTNIPTRSKPYFLKRFLNYIIEFKRNFSGFRGCSIKIQISKIFWKIKYFL